MFEKKMPSKVIDRYGCWKSSNAKYVYEESKKQCSLIHWSQEDLIISSMTLWKLHQVVCRIPKHMKPQKSKLTTMQRKSDVCMYVSVVMAIEGMHSVFQGAPRNIEWNRKKDDLLIKNTECSLKHCGNIVETAPGRWHDSSYETLELKS